MGESSRAWRKVSRESVTGRRNNKRITITHPHGRSAVARRLPRPSSSSRFAAVDALARISSHPRHFALGTPDINLALHYAEERRRRRHGDEAVRAIRAAGLDERIRHGERRPVNLAANFNAPEAIVALFRCCPPSALSARFPHLE